jgi:hypothetical protein
VKEGFWEGANIYVMIVRSPSRHPDSALGTLTAHRAYSCNDYDRMSAEKLLTWAVSQLRDDCLKTAQRRSRSVTRFRRHAWGRASADLAGERARTTRGARLAPFASRIGEVTG